jgi:hypothetical protein
MGHKNLIKTNAKLDELDAEKNSMQIFRKCTEFMTRISVFNSSTEHQLDAEKWSMQIF